MFYREKRRPDTRWTPWTATGSSTGRPPGFALQAHVEGLETRQLLSNIHFLPGGDPEFSLSEDGRTVSVSFTIAGIGNRAVDVRLAVAGTADVALQNPGQGGGPHFPPGQQQPFTLVTEDFVRTENKNGSVTYTASFTVTDEAILGGLNVKPKWSPVINSVDLISATLTISQGKDVLGETHVF